MPGESVEESRQAPLPAMPSDICIECGTTIQDGGWPTCYRCWFRWNYGIDQPVGGTVVPSEGVENV